MHVYLYVYLSLCMYICICIHRHMYTYIYGDAFEVCGGRPKPKEDRGSINDLFKSGSLNM